MKPRNTIKMLGWLAVLILFVGEPMLGAIAMATILLLAVAYWVADCMVEDKWVNPVSILKNMFF